MRSILVLFLVPACAGSPALDRGSFTTPPDSAADSSSAAARGNWKERLEQPYLFLEVKGDYRGLGEAFESLLAEVQALGIRPEGAPFALFFDDPGRIPSDELRAHVCCPVRERPARTGSLRFECLQRAMVVYAKVRGPHAEVARSYPALFSYLHELGWRQGGPVREVYLAAAREDGLVQPITEIQIPGAYRAE